MKRLFLGNFDFEHALPTGVPPTQIGSDNVIRLQSELAALWPAVADDGDFIWLPEAVEEDFFAELPANGLPAVRPVQTPDEIDAAVEACPWGWTDEMRETCERHGWRYAAPPQSVIREVNSRRFSLELERSWGIAPDGAAIVREAGDLTTALQRLPPEADRWVLKAEFGMSARERILGRGKEPGEQALNWLRKRTAAGDDAVLEPWLERIEEAGLQYTVPFDGGPLFEGVAPLLCDSSGRYRGNRFHHDVEEELRWMPAIETGMRVAKLLRQLGYFGPLGIDAMRYRDRSGNERIRPVQDVNARHSMGRLALGLRRVLKPGERAAWLHVTWPTDEIDAPRRWFNRLADSLPAGVRVVRTSPFIVGDQPVGHGTLVVAAESQSALESAEAVFLNAG